MSGEKLELRSERESEPLERPAGRRGQVRQRRFQLAGRLRQHGLEEAAFRVEVVEEELLVDARPPGDLVDARAREATPGKLFASSGENP
jgi:hypothetical protein